MVGASAMGPQPFAVEPREGETEEEARKRILDRFEEIGLQIMSRRGRRPVRRPTRSPASSATRRSAAWPRRSSGQAYVTAHVLMFHNRGSGRRTSRTRCSPSKELFGDDLLELLERGRTCGCPRSTQRRGVVAAAVLLGVAADATTRAPDAGRRVHERNDLRRAGS